MSEHLEHAPWFSNIRVYAIATTRGYDRISLGIREPENMFRVFEPQSMFWLFEHGPGFRTCPVFIPKSNNKWKINTPPPDLPFFHFRMFLKVSKKYFDVF